MLLTTVFAALVASAAAASDKRRFAVLRHYGKGPLTTCRADPIINPGTASGHVHTVMGASNFGLNSTGEDLVNSRCTTAKPKADMSAYWFPTLYFHDPIDGHFEPVKFFYMNVYYFFDATNDDVKAFPLGLQMISGDATLRSAPVKSGDSNLDPSDGPVQPAQWTCPRGNMDPPSWPAGSDGSMAGIQDTNNKGSGIGFPFQDCDGYASPLRMDLHFPSCYNPAAGLTNYKANMAFPSDAGNGKHDCPKGWIHTPHIFYEVYWDTHALKDRFQNMIGKESPFVLANGDTTGYSIHGDFLSGWNEKALQQIIDSECDAGHAGIHSCPGLQGGVNDDSTSCNIECPIKEQVDGKLTQLPGNNKLAGWKYGAGSGGAGGGGGGGGAAPTMATPSPKPPASTSQVANPAPPASSSKAAPPPAPPAESNTVMPDPGDYAGNTKPAPTPVSVTGSFSTTKPVEDSPEPTPANGGAQTTTVWETATVWATKTVYGKPGSAAPTKGAAPSSDGKAVAGYKYAGCFKDANERILSGEIRPNLGRISNTLCVTYCASKGWAVAGTEYGGQCYCGNALKKVEKIADSECSMKCEGAAGESCGGGWALSVYTKTGAVPGAAQKRHLHNHLHNHRRSGPSLRRR
ncbi:hypothetical protein B0H66DRAFT_197601 [Apodospora peruviana]|uniref:WSC domain-containing protein n=1 Tax=Apodospora peruviana TaxID=516989 RepID=A0AAE0ICN5_9PEZI|nr:hypothetical protein B0H66DRAFT_197601 [Apodospora peruviana]